MIDKFLVSVSHSARQGIFIIAPNRGGCDLRLWLVWTKLVFPIRLSRTAESKPDGTVDQRNGFFDQIYPESFKQLINNKINFIAKPSGLDSREAMPTLFTVFFTEQ